jgi:PASTA domain
MRRRVGIASIVVLAVLAGGAAGWVFHRPPARPPAAVAGPSSTRAVVPDVVGQRLHAASVQLLHEGLGPLLLVDPTIGDPGSRITGQRPSAGAVVRLGTDVELEVSRAPSGVVQGLHRQIDWDKSHLLDCWTALVRILDRPRLDAIFGTPNNGYLIRSAETGRGVAYYVRRCASDAVP